MASTLGKRSRDALPSTPTKRRVIQLQTPETTPNAHKRVSSMSSMSSTSSVCSFGSTPYSPAKSVLRRSATAEIVGREKEMTIIRDFITGGENLLYICGPPGTGKSATVTHLISQPLQCSTTRTTISYRVVNVNCVSLKKPEHIYELVLAELGQVGSTVDDLRTALKVMNTRGEQILVILDEVDYLISNHSGVMYALFESAHASHFKIIGIANALNLTDSMLPHLRRSGIEPAVLRFKPYTPAEITQILVSRVSEIRLPSGTTNIVEKSALDFLGRKVANSTGDIRKALDILRKSIEVVESEYRSVLSSLPVNNSSPKLTTVGIKHMSKVAAQALGGGTTGTSLVSTLAIHEKAILCTILVRKTTTPTSTFDAYVALCSRDKMLTPLSRSEFTTVLSGMLDNSVLISPNRTKQGLGRSPSKRSKVTTHLDDKIVLGLSEMDVLKGIGEIGILKRFFD